MEPHDLMPVLYVTQPEAVLSKTYEAFTLAVKKEDDTWKKYPIPAETIEQIVLMGNPGITGDALTQAMELGIPVHYLTYYGKYIGSMLPGHSRNGQLRLAQYGLYYDTPRRLELVKAIVAAKIHNQALILYRQKADDTALKTRKKAVAGQEAIDKVRGIEGLAAREYFQGLQSILDDSWGFNGRHRPPPDPVNALLSFAYGLLRTQVTAAVHIAGLDPYIGYLHEVHHGQPSLPLDLMEEFRPLVADSLVLTLINRKEIAANDFEDSLGSYRLKEAARKNFLQAFERKMNDEFKHPVFEYRCTYRRAIQLQARLLNRFLVENSPYKPLMLR
jgi:CRISP-associated protein Cas1